MDDRDDSHSVGRARVDCDRPQRRGMNSLALLVQEAFKRDPHGGDLLRATSLVQRKSVPSTQMRCMITANRRARATIAFFIPLCLATFIAQAFSQDHFDEWNSMLWAAS
jgi:hypothetical protein